MGEITYKKVTNFYEKLNYLDKKVQYIDFIN